LLSGLTEEEAADLLEFLASGAESPTLSR